MGIFDLNEAQAAMKDSKPQYAPLPEGKYLGKITEGTVGKTAAGHSVVKLKLKLDGQKGFHFVDLNLDHEKTKAISKKTLGEIFTYGYKNPPVKLDSVLDVALACQGAPVSVTIKHKGLCEKGYMRFGTYFNEVPESLKVDFASRDAGTEELEY